MSLELVFRTLHAVGDLQPVGVSELARELSTPKTSVHRTLQRLEEVGWVKQGSAQESSRWVLTAAPLTLSRKVAGDSNLKALALAEMQSLHDRHQEAIHLAMPEGDSAVVVERLECPKPIRIHWAVGNNAPFHASAHGRVFLAFSSGPRFDALFPKSFTQVAKKTIHNKVAFLEELKNVRALGYAFVFEELRDDIASVAAPIFGSTGEPEASISIFFPSYRTPENIELLGHDVMEATGRISRALKTS